MQCQVGLYFLSNSFFIYAAISWKNAMYQHLEVHNQPTNQESNFSVLTYFLNVVLFQCLCCTIHSILLHFLRHISIFDNGFAFRHLAWPATIRTTQALAPKKKIITPYQKLLFSFMQKWQLNHAITVWNSSQLPTNYKSIPNLTRLPLLTRTVAVTSTSISWQKISKYWRY